jgi:hypothetical protein
MAETYKVEMYYKVQAIGEVTIQTSFENNPIPYIC